MHRCAVVGEAGAEELGEHTALWHELVRPSVVQTSECEWIVVYTLYPHFVVLVEVIIKMNLLIDEGNMSSVPLHLACSIAWPF